MDEECAVLSAVATTRFLPTKLPKLYDAHVPTRKQKVDERFAGHSRTNHVHQLTFNLSEYGQTMDEDCAV